MESQEDEGQNKDAVVKTFESIDYEYTTLDVIQELKKEGYQNPGEMILTAIEDNLLYVSSVENDGTIYFALSGDGEEKWKIYNHDTTKDECIKDSCIKEEE